MTTTGLTDAASRQSAARAAMAALFRGFAPPTGVRWEELPDGAWQATPAHPLRTGVILHVHGGGFTLGDPSLYGGFLGSLAAQTGMRVRSLHYRLAPEHPFPLGLQDIFSALERTDATNFSVIADSAGAALALSALHRLHASTGRTARRLVLLSPLLRIDQTSGSYVENKATDRMFSAGALATLRTAYLAGKDPTDPEVSPLYADVDNLPPVQIHASTTEVLRDDATALAAKLEGSGRQADLRLIPGQVHAWPTFQGDNVHTHAVIEAAASFIAEAHEPARPISD